MFSKRAFRSWGHILVGACAFAFLFLAIMVLSEEVIGQGARLSRAAVTLSVAAFVGYVGTAWLVRHDDSSRQ